MEVQPPIPLEQIPPMVGNYEIGEVMGTGAYGVVVSARHCVTAEEVAIKVISRRLLDENAVLGAFEQECRIHQSLKHENIVRVYEIQYETDFVFVILELCRGGDLLDYIHNNVSRPIRRILSFWYQILKAIAYLHERGIAHLDIKPENILLADADTVKLADFGCCEAPPKYDRGNAKGTPKYSAPEILTVPRSDNRAADIWSLGIMLFTAATGMFPFQAGSDDEITQQILTGHMAFPLSMSPDVVGLVQECCQVDPEKRPLITDLIAKPIFDRDRRGITSSVTSGGTRLKISPSDSGYLHASPSIVGEASLKKGLVVRPTAIRATGERRVSGSASMSVRPNARSPGRKINARVFSPSPQPWLPE
jgi:serine/threonine protein kinase